MNKTCILHLPPGSEADIAFLQEAVIKFPTVFGFAFQSEGRLETECHAKAWKAEEIVELVNYAKDGHRIIMLGNWPTHENLDDVQPFVLRDSTDEPFLAMFMEGDFAGYAGLHEKHTDEYNVSEELVFPRIEKAYKDADGDIGKFLEELNGKAVRQVLSNGFKHRGVYLFLPKEGAPITFGENTIGAEYSWGTASNIDGISYTEAAPAAEGKEGSKLSFLDRMRGKSSAEPAAPPPVPAEPDKVAQPSSLPLRNNPKKEGVGPAPTDTSIALVLMAPPPGLQSGARNHWLRLFNAKDVGQLPPDHQSNKVQIWVHPSMVEYAKRPVSSTKNMRDLTNEIKAINSGGGPKDFKPTTADTGKSTVREAFQGSSYTGTSTVLGVKDKEKAVGLLAGFLDKKLSPLEIQKMEAKWPTYSDEVGVSFEELLFLSSDQMMQLFDGNKPAVACIIQFRRKYIEGSNIKLEDLVTGSSKGEEPKDTNASPDKVVEKSAVAQGGGLSFLRRTG